MAHLGFPTLSQVSGSRHTSYSASQATLRQGVQMEKIDPVLLEAAIRVFGNEALAMHWLMTKAHALADKRPVDATVEDALDLLARLEHGLGA